MKISRFRLGLLFTAVLCHGALANPAGEVEFLKAEGETAFFTSPAKPIKTGLTELSYVGKIHSTTGDPFFFFKGRSCSASNCPYNLFAFPSTLSEKYSQTTKPSNFVYPGVVTDRKKGVIYKSRAFLGKCLTTRDFRGQEVYAVFQDERVDKRNRVQSSVFVTQPALPYWTERLLTARPIPRIQDTLQQVKLKNCIEIPGLSRTPISKPLNIKLPPALENEETDNDDENDTEDSAPTLAPSPSPTL